MRVSEHANYLLNEYGRLQFDYAAYCKPNGESLRNEARNNLEEYIAELEAYIDELVKAGDGMQRSLNAYLDYTQEIFDYKCYAPEDATSKWQALVKDWKERMTMSELKPCPFCGEMPQVNTWMMHGITESRCFCDNEKCPVYLSKTIAIDDWNNRPIEDALNARIAELEAENERLSQLLHECKALESENAELRDVIGDYRNDASRVLDEKCPSDERHCGCVPILRDQLNKYQKALILITTMPELSQATTIAREALQERGKFIWTEQSVGEYWVNKLDILQDKFDALEKDYADVCQKRLEAADVFSRQIIELESENAKLEAERRWIPVGERLPEEKQDDAGETVDEWGKPDWVGKDVRK